MNGYNPYDAAARIVQNKGSWIEAKLRGGDTEKYHNDALEYYEELRNNGYGDVADRLEASGYNEALEVLEQLKEYNEYGTPDRAADEYDSGAADDRISEMVKRYGELYTALTDGSWQNSDTYKTIMANYAAEGKRAAYSGLADTAASNAGNVDSYAAANAHRQNLSYLKAGESAARQAYTDSVKTALTTLSGLSDSQSAVSTLFQSGISHEKDILDGALASFADGATLADGAKVNTGASVNTDTGASFNTGAGVKTNMGTNVNTATSDDTALKMEKYLNYLLAMYPEYANQIREIFVS